MDYKSVYFNIINRARNRELDCYSERHHIVPRSIGGGNEDANIVRLTYREHFLAHWLLTKIYVSSLPREKMRFALGSMGMWHNSKRKLCTAWQYSIAKTIVNEIKTGRPGHKHTEAHKQKMSKKYKGIPLSEEAKVKLRKPKSEIGKANMRTAWTPERRVAQGERTRIMNIASIGKRRCSEAQKQKMSKARLGLKFSELHKQNLRIAWQRRRNKINEGVSL